MTTTSIDVSNGDWENPGGAIDEAFGYLRQGLQKYQQEQGYTINISVYGIYEIAADDQHRERLCQLLRQAAPFLTRLVFAPTQNIILGADYETMLAHVPQRLQVEQFVQVLSAIPEKHRYNLQSIILEELVVQGNLHPLANVVGTLTGLTQFAVVFGCFHGENDDEESSSPQILARQLRGLPNLTSFYWSNLPFHRLEVATLLCQSQSLTEFSLGLGCDNEPSTHFDEAFRRFCQAIQHSRIRRFVLERVSEMWYLTDTNFHYLASAIENNSTIQEVLLNSGVVGPISVQFVIDPLIKAVANNTNIVRFQMSYGDVNVASSDCFDLLLESLMSSNSTLRYFILQSHRLNKECRHKFKTVDLYCRLNRNFPRRRILTDESFTKQEFVKLLPWDETVAQQRRQQSHLFSHQHSLCFLLLRTKPDLWLPSFHEDTDSSSNNKTSKKRKVPP